MQKYLMHKDVPAAKLEIDQYGCGALSVINKEHMPVGVVGPNIELMFDRWNRMRSIPGNRYGLDRIIAAVGNIEEAKIQAMAMSLTDCYWLKDPDMPLSWIDVNYHDNGFAETLKAPVLFDMPAEINDIKTPDLTTDGVLPKTWIPLNGEVCLIKRSSEKQIESANEVAAYRIAKTIGLSAVQYFPVRLGSGEMACGTPCFIDNNNLEFVNGLQIAEENGGTGVTLYHAFSKMGFRNEVNSMIVFDYLIHGTDRHEKNFGIIRDSETLQPVSFAPLFDNGASFGSHLRAGLLDTNETKPFLTDRDDQIALVKELPFELPDRDMVKNIVAETYQIFDVQEERLQNTLADIERTYDKVMERFPTFEVNYDDEMNR